MVVVRSPRNTDRQPTTPTHRSPTLIGMQPSALLEGVTMGSPDAITIAVESRDDLAHIRIGGELDMFTAPVLEGTLATAEQDGVRMIMLDLRDLTFIDSSGLRVFVRAWDHAKANGHQLRLLGASSEANRLFKMTGTEFLVDEQEATSAPDL